MEIAIPFNTLRFVPGSIEAWGLNFGRRIARKREEAYWAFISPEWGFNAKFRAARYGQLTGIERARPGGRLKLKPTRSAAPSKTSKRRRTRTSR